MNLQKEISSDIKRHAIEEYPRECCGLILKNANGILIRRCKNAHGEPQKNFLIHYSDIIDAEKCGELIGSYHSHAHDGHSFSDVDKASAESTGLPMWVYSYQTNQFNMYIPSGFKLPLEGRPFAWGVSDCYILIRDYYREALAINLPEKFDHIDRTSPKDVVDGDLFEKNFADAGFSRIIGLPIKHDVAMMKIGSKKINHVGIYLGENKMLHQPAGKLSCKVFYGDNWKKVTDFFVRHRDYGK